MKRKVLFLLILIGLVGLVIGVVKLISDRSPQQGVLKINADPGSSVFLDNRHLGKTPFEDKVDQGEYEIKLVPESTTQAISSWQGKVKVTKNLLTYINANLAESEFQSAVDVLWLEKITSSKSEIAVITNPDGAQVSIDGDSKGSTPLTLSDMTPGDHTIGITSPGFAPHSVKVKATAGYKLIITIKLAIISTNMIAQTASDSASLASSSASLISPTPTGKSKITPVTTPTGKITGTPTDTPRITPSLTPKSTPVVSITPTSGAVGGETNPTKPYILVKDTPTGYLNVRKTPSGDYLDKVNPGEKYSIQDEQNGWFQIKYDGTNLGWVSGQYCEKIE